LLGYVNLGLDTLSALIEMRHGRKPCTLLASSPSPVTSWFKVAVLDANASM
jgi:hypothetical protein